MPVPDSAIVRRWRVPLVFGPRGSRSSSLSVIIIVVHGYWLSATELLRSIAAIRVWNDLPHHLTTRTHLFSRSFLFASGETGVIIGWLFMLHVLYLIAYCCILLVTRCVVSTCSRTMEHEQPDTGVAGQRPYQRVPSYVLHVVLSCVVLVCCNPCCGLVALILAGNPCAYRVVQMSLAKYCFAYLREGLSLRHFPRGDSSQVEEHRRNYTYKPNYTWQSHTEPIVACGTTSQKNRCRRNLWLTTGDMPKQTETCYPSSARPFSRHIFFQLVNLRHKWRNYVMLTYATHGDNSTDA